MGNTESLTNVDQPTVDPKLTIDKNRESHSKLLPDPSIDDKIKSLKEDAYLPQGTSSVEKIHEDSMKSSIEEGDLKFSKNYSNSLQSWKGNVVSIEDEFFVAELEDLTHGGTREIAEIELMSVSPDDQNLVQIGAAFYWNIGYKMNQGQITKESIIRFQRLINWDEEDYNNAADRASDLFDNINID